MEEEQDQDMQGADRSLIERKKRERERAYRDSLANVERIEHGSEFDAVKVSDVLE